MRFESKGGKYDVDSAVAFHEKEKRRRVFLDLESINTVTQMRTTVTGIDELAANVLDRGQLQPGTVAVFNRKQAEAYLATIKDVYGAEHAVESLTSALSNGEEVYLILIAGHRRYHACKQLVQQQKFSDYFRGTYLADLRWGLTPDDALSIQFSENTHVQVPPHEEAVAAARVFRWKRHKNPSLSVAGFARSVGRSPDWARRALRFAGLPNELQEYAEGKGGIRVPYGILVEVARYAEELQARNVPIVQEDLLYLVHRSLIKRMSVDEFKKLISLRLREIAGQQSLFSHLPYDERPIRQVVAHDVIRSLWGLVAYLGTLSSMQNNGAFGPEHHLGPERNKAISEQYSPSSPLRLASELCRLLITMLPGLEALARQHNGGRHAQTLSESKSVLAEVLPVLERLSEHEKPSLEGAQGGSLL